MTTIAVSVSKHYVTMACDGRLSDDTTKFSDSCCKVHRIGQYLVGFAGGVSDCMALITWMQGGCEGKQPRAPTAELIIVGKDGRVLTSEGGKPPFEIDAPAAIGSGSDHAVTALDLGCTAADAVRAAMKRDVKSGGRVTTLRMRRHHASR